MLALTKRTDYALIALTYLAGHPEGVATARAIAERYQVPLSLLMNVLKTLAQHGIVRSVRGSKGGYALAADPASFTLRDLIEALEGPIRFVQCAQSDEGGEPCELLKLCPVSRPVRRVHERLEQFLDEITLAEIASDACCRGNGHESGATISLGVPRVELKV